MAKKSDRWRCEIFLEIPAFSALSLTIALDVSSALFSPNAVTIADAQSGAQDLSGVTRPSLAYKKGMKFLETNVRALVFVIACCQNARCLFY